MLPEGSVARPAWTDTVSGRQLNDEERQREARWWYEQQSSARGLLVVSGLLLLIAAVIAAIGMRLVLGQRRLRGRLEAIMPYWRGLPPISPGAAALVYDIANGVTADKRLGGRQLGATMLSLVTKGFARMYPGPVERYRGIDLLRTDATTLARMASARGAGDDDTTSTIVLLPRVFGTMVVDGGGAAPELCRSEQRLLSILREAYERLHTPVFDIKQMNKAFRQWEDGHLSVELFTDACDDECAALGATQHASPAAVTLGIFDILVGVLAGIYFMASDGNVLLTCCLSLPAVFCGLFACIANKDFRIPESGQRTIGELVGFDRYLEDFSEFSDREVLDVTLWGRYLVYAAALGVSRKVLQQLAAAYPQVNDAAWLDDNAAASGVLFWSARPSTIVGASLGSALAGGSFGAFSGGFVDFGTQLSSGMASVQSTISAAAPSSSSSGGSGGSFSGGGFGGSSGGSGGGSFGGR